MLLTSPVVTSVECLDLSWPDYHAVCQVDIGCVCIVALFNKP